MATWSLSGLMVWFEVPRQGASAPGCNGEVFGSSVQHGCYRDLYKFEDAGISQRAQYPLIKEYGLKGFILWFKLYC